jgi:hypothetical protein
VVVPDQVEKAVDEEMRDLASERPPRPLRLDARRLDRDVDLAKEEVAAAVVQVAGRSERKGEDVGGPVRLEEIAVQSPDACVVGQDQRDRSAGKAQDPERPSEERLKSGRL